MSGGHSSITAVGFTALFGRKVEIWKEIFTLISMLLEPYTGIWLITSSESLIAPEYSAYRMGA